MSDDRERYEHLTTTVKLTPIRRAKHGPEWHLQNEHFDWMTDRGWYGKRFIGNALQSGVPDFLWMHERYGQRWVDYKIEGNYEFTTAQIDEWPKWEAKNTGIWIITACTQEQYDLFFTRLPLGNWRDYWKDKYNFKPLDLLIDELAKEEGTLAVSRDGVRDGGR